MILGMEVGMLVMGLYALVTGRMPLSNERVVRGAAARWLGLVSLLPVPLAFCGGLVAAVVMVSRGQDLMDESVKWLFVAIEAGTVLLCAIFVGTVGAAVARKPGRSPRPRRQDDEAYRRCFAAAAAAGAVPGDAVQGTVPLRTMALAGYHTPPLPAEPPPEELSKAARTDWGVMIVVGAVVAATSMNAARRTSQDNPQPAAAQAAGAEQQDRVEPAGVRPRAGEPPARTLSENERADWPAQIPARPHDALFVPGAPVYLSDLPEFAWKRGAAGWAFGKGGRLGAPDRPEGVLRYLGETPAKGLSMHPPHRGYARVCYALGRRAQSLRARVFLSDDDRRLRPNPTRFVILGDGQLLWRSPSMRQFGSASWFSLDVSQVDVLELRTYVETGNSTGSHAGWFDPYVVVKQ